MAAICRGRRTLTNYRVLSVSRYSCAAPASHAGRSHSPSPMTTRQLASRAGGTVGELLDGSSSARHRDHAMAENPSRALRRRENFRVGVDSITAVSFRDRSGFTASNRESADSGPASTTRCVTRPLVPTRSSARLMTATSVDRTIESRRIMRPAGAMSAQPRSLNSTATEPESRLPPDSRGIDGRCRRIAYRRLLPTLSGQLAPTSLFAFRHPPRRTNCYLPAINQLTGRNWSGSCHSRRRRRNKRVGPGQPRCSGWRIARSLRHENSLNAGKHMARAVSSTGYSSNSHLELGELATE